MALQAAIPCIQFTKYHELQSTLGGDKYSDDLILFDDAPEPGRAADTAGAVRGLGAIYPAKRYGLLATRQCATFSRCIHPAAPGAPEVGRTHIAWQLPLLAVLHPSDACQRRS